MTGFVPCPEPACDSPAEVESRGYANGGPMPVEMVKTHCLQGHWFMGARDHLVRDA